MSQRKSVDMAAYIEGIQTKPCFICKMLEDDPAYRHHIIYKDETAVVFLNKYPVLYGYVIVAPREHREQVSGDFSLAEYLDLQRIIYRVAEALRQEIPTERVYILSLGSQQGNRHVHWHVASLPPGIPFEQQQFEALNMEENGILALTEEEMAALARRISGRL